MNEVGILLSLPSLPRMPSGLMTATTPCRQSDRQPAKLTTIQLDQKTYIQQDSYILDIQHYVPRPLALWTTTTPYMQRQTVSQTYNHPVRPANIHTASDTAFYPSSSPSQASWSYDNNNATEVVAKLITTHSDRQNSCS